MKTTIASVASTTGAAAAISTGADTRASLVNKPLHPPANDRRSRRMRRDGVGSELLLQRDPRRIELETLPLNPVVHIDPVIAYYGCGRAQRDVNRDRAKGPGSRQHHHHQSQHSDT